MMDNHLVPEVLQTLEENAWEFRTLTTEQLRVFSKTFPRELNVSEHTLQNYRRARKNYRAFLNRQNKRKSKEVVSHDTQRCVNTTDGVDIVPDAEKQEIMHVLKPSVSYLDTQRLFLNHRTHCITLEHARCKHSSESTTTSRFSKG